MDRTQYDYVPPEVSDEDLEGYAGGKYGAKSFELGANPCLLVIDMTNEFVEPEYSTGSKSGLQCADNVAKLLEEARDADLPVVFTRYPGYHIPAEVGQWADSIDEFELLEEDAYKIHPTVAPAEDEPVLEKCKPSGFFDTQLESVLNYYNCDSLIICGLTTSGCVRATVVDAFSYNYDIVVPMDCVGDRSEISHRINLFDMSMKYAKVKHSDEVLEQIAVL